MKERLNDWWSNNEPNENLIYKDELREQCLFVRDTLMKPLFLSIATDYDSYKDYVNEKCDISRSFIPWVIGTHRSKSVLLPVMEMDLSSIGLKIILRNNFYDWCISVESKKDVDCDFMGLITDREGFYEGFPEDRIYPAYSESNKKKFSLCVGNEYQVYTFIFLIRNWVVNQL